MHDQFDRAVTENVHPEQGEGSGAEQRSQDKLPDRPAT